MQNMLIACRCNDAFAKKNHFKYQKQPAKTNHKK